MSFQRDGDERAIGVTGGGEDRHIAVIGGGAVGVTAAYDLATAEASVTVFEKDSVGSGSSGRAAGILYDAYAEDIDAEVGERALARFRNLSGEGEFEFVDCPYVFLAREDDDVTGRALVASVERMRDHGRNVEVVNPVDLGESFPLVTDDVVAAAVAYNAGWADPGSYVSMMADRAADAGVEFRTGEAAGVDVDAPGVVVDGETESFDAVLVAAGAHTKRLFAEAGVSIALKPYRVQALTSVTPYDGPMVFDATADVYFRPHPDGMLAGDGTEPVEADPDDWDRSGDDWFVENLHARLRERADYDLEPDRAWAGLCTATPDGDPLLGELRDGVFVAAGWQGHGFMRAPATGEIIADQMLGGDGIDYFDPTRFDGDEEFEIVEGMAVE